MSVESIHQLVHGYRQGHELLVGSVELSPVEEDLIARLSDLSGTLSTDTKFDPYLTIYPLPSGEFHAVAKTWLDDDAPRSGCVLTHTLLVPTDYWVSIDNPMRISTLFACPSLRTLDRFQAEMNVLPHLRSETDEFIGPRSGVALEFVSKYFGEGVRPLIWFNESNPEYIVWRILKAIWPELRRQFACCTFSLQPRELDNRPFDLLFAPLDVYSRFHTYGRNHILDIETQDTREIQSREDTSGWLHNWASIIFGDSTQEFPDPAHGELIKLLNEDPTSIRRLFLFKDLQIRVSSYPEAIIGMLDVLDSLAPHPTTASSYKRTVLHQAISASRQFPTKAETFECLKLLGERLDRDAFKEVGSEAQEKVEAEVALRTIETPELALRVSSSVTASWTHGRTRNSAFQRGVLKGLETLASDSPAHLLVLRKYPDVASHVIASEPKIAAGYIRGIEQGESSDEAVSDLIGWIESVQSPNARKGIRNAIFPLISKSEDAPIVAALLGSLKANEIAGVLSTLAENTSGFAINSIRDVIKTKIAEAYPREVRTWARDILRWSNGVASVIAATFSPTLEGLRELLNFSLSQPAMTTEAIAMFLRDQFREHYPVWLREEVENNPEFILQFLGGLSRGNRTVNAEATRLLNEMQSIPITRDSNIIQEIEKFRNYSFYERLTTLAVRSALTNFINGEISWEDYSLLQEKVWAMDWIRRVDVPEFRSLVAQSQRTKLAPWVRSWQWIANAPTSLYNRDEPVLLGMIDTMVSSSPGKWSKTATDFWIQTLERVERESSKKLYLMVCVQALKFSFENPTYPLSRLVIASFPRVYLASVREPNASAVIAPLFGIFDWNREKDLTKRLINSFYDSTWPPGDLALAVQELELMRKIVEGVRRKKKGKRYVLRMLEDLSERSSPRDTKARQDLEVILRKRLS